jgi:tripartite ATP-independent transporter DctM subunit
VEALAISFVILLLLGVPVVFVLGISMLAYFVSTDQLQFLLVLPQRMFAGVDEFVLLAIPLFVLAGNLMEVGGLTHRLLDFANVCVGRFRGGVSLTAIWASFLFGGVSGSAAADAAALGGVLIPEMKRQGYNNDYAAALMGVSSLMAPLIPPSIAMVIYGALSNTSIARLFVAGIIPGVMLAIALTAYASWVARRRNYPWREPPTRGEFFRAAIAAIPVMVLPVIIVVGIRGGVFTPTEAAAVAAIYAFLVATFYYRVMSFGNLWKALFNTAVISAAIFMLVAMANIASFIFAMEQIPDKVVKALFAISSDPVAVLLMVNVVLLFLGMILDTIGILILTVPALIGIGHVLHMDPVHLGVMVVFNCLIGFVTPPVGLCLFIVAGVGKTTIDKVAYHALPMIGIAIAILMLITFIPQIVLFLPRLIVG